MLKIQCPECKKSFLWTDDMPIQDKCPNQDCEWHYNIQSELKRNIAKRGISVEQKKLHCPFCSEEISSRFTTCNHCGNIVLGTKAFKKSYVFVAVCIILILLSLILKYLVK
jgi:predicted nucleic acid-binding Zn ribbon protein